MYREAYDDGYAVRERPVVAERPVVYENRGSGLAGYALVKYAFILAITIVVLYFAARYLIPLVNGNS